MVEGGGISEKKLLALAPENSRQRRKEIKKKRKKENVLYSSGVGKRGDRNSGEVSAKVVYGPHS